MKRIAIYPLLLLFALCGCKGKTGTSQAGNVFKPGEIWPDNNGVHINAHGGGMLQQGDTYYWFGEHKTEGEGGNVAQVGVHCYSSKDLYNWKDEGIALSVSDDESSPIVKGCILERPKVIFNKKTGRYVMWFHLEPKGAGYTGAKSGVAVSEKVTGPYKLLSADRPNAGFWPKNVLDIHKGPVPEESKKGFGGGGLPAHPDTLNLLGRDFESGQMARDMNLFVDDDGKAYHIYASEDNSTLHISELTDDYTACSGNYARFFVGRFMEAPAMFKKNGKYYHVRLHRLGAESRPFRCRIFYLGAVERVGESVCGSRFGNLFPLAEHLCAACSRQARTVHLHGRPLDTEERHRRPLYLVAYPFRRRTAGYRVAGRMGN